MYQGLPTPGGPEPRLEYSYTGVLTRAARPAVLDHLAAAGFTGYVGPQEGDWVVVVPVRRRGVTAPDALDALAAALAAATGAAALAVSVHRDRVLRLTLCDGAAEPGRYVSDPAFGAEPDDEGWGEPEGVEHAAAFAAAAGAPDRADELAGLLGEPLDEDEQTESERLSAVLRLLGLPRWLVAADQLPGDVPAGPAAGEVTRLHRGRTGLGGRVRAWTPRRG